MADSFFELPGEPSDIDQNAFFELTKSGGVIRSKIYRPASLTSPEPSQRWRVRDCQFNEVSFTKTLVEEIEFRKCTFTACLFIGTVFKNCRFSECTFVNSNTHRVEFIDVYLNPRSFRNCLDKSRHQNIGVHLYQELLNNSRRQSQPDFAHEALFQFRRWLRLEQIYRLRQSGIKLAQAKPMMSIALNWAGEKFLGYGVRLSIYFRTAAIGALILAVFNYYFASQFGLKIGQEPLHSFVDALYFTIITLTTVGYGDITPTTPIGRIAIAGEGFSGLVMFAILASMIYRKILP